MEDISRILETCQNSNVHKLNITCQNILHHIKRYSRQPKMIITYPNKTKTSGSNLPKTQDKDLHTSQVIDPKIQDCGKNNNLKRVIIKLWTWEFFSCMSKANTLVMLLQNTFGVTPKANTDIYVMDLLWNDNPHEILDICISQVIADNFLPSIPKSI